jgi:hypothetical protein
MHERIDAAGWLQILPPTVVTMADRRRRRALPSSDHVWNAMFEL